MEGISQQELVKSFTLWQSRINGLCAGMDKLETKWKRPSPHYCLLFAAEEIGEAIGAWIVYTMPGAFSRNHPENKHPDYERELAQCLMMLLMSNSSTTELAYSAWLLCSMEPDNKPHPAPIESLFGFVGETLMYQDEEVIGERVVWASLWAMAMLWPKLDDLMCEALDKVAKKHAIQHLIPDLGRHDERAWLSIWEKVAQYGESPNTLKDVFLVNICRWLNDNHAQIIFDDEVHKYKELWPNHCVECGGWGGFWLSGTDWENPPDNTPCKCVLTQCPRCATQHPDNTEDPSDQFPCKHCAFNFDDGLPFLP